jgi:hypothetical protein
MKFRDKEDFFNRIDQFLRVLLEIERRHYYWFESRHGVSKTQEHDVLANHVVISVEFPKLQFGYWDDSELPTNIQEERNREFDKLFIHDSHWDTL